MGGCERTALRLTWRSGKGAAKGSSCLAAAANDRRALADPPLTCLFSLRHVRRYASNECDLVAVWFQRHDLGYATGVTAAIKRRFQPGADHLVLNLWADHFSRQAQDV